MANRNWANGGKVYSMHVKPILANVNITIGASGAVSSFIGTITASVTHISTGIYRMNFQNNNNFGGGATNFAALLSASGACQSPSSGLSGVLGVEIQNAANTSVSSATAPSLTVKCLDAAGALVDPASGSVLSVMMFLSDSHVKA